MQGKLDTQIPAGASEAGQISTVPTNKDKCAIISQNTEQTVKLRSVKDKQANDGSDMETKTPSAYSTTNKEELLEYEWFQINEQLRLMIQSD